MIERLASGSRSVTVLDASPDMLSLAKARGGAAEYVLGPVEAIPLADKCVDVVVSVRLFGHLPAEQKAKALSEFARVGRMGAVVFYAGDSKWLHARRARAGRDRPDWYPVSDSSMQAMARDAGLEAVGGLRLLGPYAETRALALRTMDGSKVCR
jgi:SAM-dependent methyltransferase